MKVDEIKRKYKDEWILIKVSKVDEFGVPGRSGRRSLKELMRMLGAFT